MIIYINGIGKKQIIYLLFEYMFKNNIKCKIIFEPKEFNIINRDTTFTYFTTVFLSLKLYKERSSLYYSPKIMYLVERDTAYFDNIINKYFEDDKILYLDLLSYYKNLYKHKIKELREYKINIINTKEKISDINETDICLIRSKYYLKETIRLISDTLIKEFI